MGEIRREQAAWILDRSEFRLEPMNVPDDVSANFRVAFGAWDMARRSDAIHLEMRRQAL